MRVCSREGCGVRLVRPDGEPDFKRRFCGKECKSMDDRERKRQKRKKFSGKKCPMCGRHAKDSGGAQDTVRLRGAEGIVVPTPARRESVAQEGWQR